MSSTVYHPISVYQTRIILLHGHNGAPASPIEISLRSADLVHPNFKGIGLRSPTHAEDSIVSCVALSYTWGETTTKKKIICNKFSFTITQNSHDALDVLRPLDGGWRYLWFDAICINQSDMEERARQVQNMLLIYKGAVKVIAWLGPAHERTHNALIAAG
ncbi:hypothetical protein EK21DRAFT_108106 [Setomelanomma holmii]|uniref:Heterokaryon incompatibility domain-containing protein n=1 Tax=Setomelanomma holmii TaxID=210430 RepID=A0A9P4LQQ0_9PLEO|nr:hypothetical protein EK21DRAFT_108106 [Setomelanomma holmii]